MQAGFHSGDFVVMKNIKQNKNYLKMLNRIWEFHVRVKLFTKKINKKTTNEIKKKL